MLHQRSSVTTITISMELVDELLSGVASADDLLDDQGLMMKPKVWLMAFGRGFREDQWLDPLLMAGHRSRRRGAGELRYQAPQPQSSIEIPQKNNEALWSAACHRGRTEFGAIRFSR